MSGLMLVLALLVALTASGAAQAQDAPLSAGEHQTIVNDVRLWYRVAGRTEGTPVVFLHGGPGQGSQTFARFAGPELEPRLRMVYLDQRGSGRSERPWNDAYSIELMVEDLEALRRAWGVPRIALVGHSFGTILGLEYAARYPDHVSKLVLVSSVPDLPAALDIQCARLERIDPEAYAQAVERLPDGSMRRCDPFSAGRAFVDGAMFPDPATKDLVDETDAMGGLRNTGQIGRTLFSAGLTEYRFAHAGRLTMPVMVVTGLEDHQTVPEPQRTLVSTLRDGRMVEHPGRGHFLFVEDPAGFAADLLEFLAE